jgi:hypothetical protein
MSEELASGLSLLPVSLEYEFRVLSLKLLPADGLWKTKIIMYIPQNFKFPLHSQSVMFYIERLVNEKNEID